MIQRCNSLKAKQQDSKLSTALATFRTSVTSVIVPRLSGSLVSNKSSGRSVGIATSYGLYDRGVGARVSVQSRIFNSPYRPHRLWGSTSLQSSGYLGLHTVNEIRNEDITSIQRGLGGTYCLSFRMRDGGSIFLLKVYISYQTTGVKS